jgi:FlaA1/EpsC-like NDP-sugar epimerase
VVPIFRRQIAEGGPVTITDPGMTRYFMTIPEAVQLIIRSGSLATAGAAGAGRGADLFVLDMGEPVRIMDLARAMIDLSGLDPDRDIDIEVIGARPGEKLHEELVNTYEHARPTDAEKILRVEREPLAVEAVEAMFEEVYPLVLEGDATGMAAKVAELAETLRGGGRPTQADGVLPPGGDGSTGHGGQPGGDAGRRPGILPERTPVVPPAGDAEQLREAPAPLVHSPNS